jgi:hypothetical protein
MSERITKHRRSGNNAMTHLIRSTGPEATSSPVANRPDPSSSRPDPSGSRHEGGNRHDGWRDTPTGSWRLVERAQAGDVQAFGALYDRYNNEVYKYLWLRCGHIQLAQDLTSDVWERALRSIGRLQFQGGIPGRMAADDRPQPCDRPLPLGALPPRGLRRGDGTGGPARHRRRRRGHGPVAYRRDAAARSGQAAARTATGGDRPDLLLRPQQPRGLPGHGQDAGGGQGIDPAGPSPADPHPAGRDLRLTTGEIR